MDDTYRVVGFKPEAPRKRTFSQDTLDMAKEMQSKYGLIMFSVEEIADIWTEHSDTYCAGWLVDCKASVESAFNVVLEKA